MQDGNSGSAVAERPRDNPRLAPPGADLVPSIAPEWGASLTAIHSRSGFPEIDCIRHAIPGAVLAAAESRAETVGVSADRVLIACGAISEEDYVRAFAAGCHAPFESLAEVSRKDCPLSDERLIESAAAGLLPLQIDGRLVLTVAPRHTAARYLAEMTARADLKGIFRLTSARRLQDFVFKHCKAGIARRAVGELENLWPELSAAPRPRSKKRAFLSIAALAVAATALSLHGTTVAVDVMLAIIFLAWSVLRLFGCLMRPPARKRPARIADDQLPTYSIIAALYREAVSVEHLVSCLRQLDYPGFMAQMPQRATAIASKMREADETHLCRLRRLIEEQYENRPTGCGASFGELLCWEIHSNGMTFVWLAQKWGVSLPTLGELVWDHCKRLEADPRVDHSYQFNR